MNRIARSSLVLSMLVVCLAVVGTANAAINFSAPAANTTLKPGSTLHIAWTGSCDAGKACGVYDAGSVADYMTMKLTHVRFGDDPSVAKGATEIGSGGSSGSYDLPVDQHITGGAWRLVATWQECTAAVAPAKVDAATCTDVSTALPLKATVLIGTKETPPHAVAVRLFRSRTMFQNNLELGCNGPKQMYRATFEVLKRVKVRGRLKWVRALRLNNRVPLNAGSTCTWVQKTRWPRGTSTRTPLRTRWTVRAIGVGKVKPKAVYSKVYTRASVSSSTTGTTVGG